MKILLTMVSLVIGTIATASATQISDLPSSLVCTAKNARMPEVRTVKITKMNTDSPESTVRDGFQEASITDDNYSLSFSDECEGWYAFDFKVSDLLLLKSGKVSKINGTFTYNDLPERFPDAGDSEENQEESITVTCKKL